MSRRRRIPPTFRDRVERVVAVATEHAVAGSGFYVQPVQHDHDCPALAAQSLAACTCDPSMPPPVRIETAADLARYLREAGA